MKYITHTSFEGKCLGGVVSIAKGSNCEVSDRGIINYNGTSICLVSSELAHKHFTRDDDGQGAVRGELIKNIIARLVIRDKQYQERWNKVWQDKLCQKYKRPEHKDFWIWNHDFYIAEIKDLIHISKLIGLEDTVECIE